jgi:hypothetical protein
MRVELAQSAALKGERERLSLELELAKLRA